MVVGRWVARVISLQDGWCGSRAVCTVRRSWSRTHGLFVPELRARRSMGDVSAPHGPLGGVLGHCWSASLLYCAAVQLRTCAGRDWLAQRQAPSGSASFSFGRHGA